MALSLEQMAATPRLGPVSALERMAAEPKMSLARMASTPSGRIFSGGPVSDIIDVVNVPFFAATGAVQAAIAGRSPIRGAVEGVKRRASWMDWIRDNVPGATERTIFGVPKYILYGGALDIALDPSWLLPPAKLSALAGTGLKAVGKIEPVAQLARTPLGQEIARSIARAREARTARQLFERLQDQMVLGVTQDVDRALELAQEIARQPRRVQRAVSEYVEAAPDALRGIGRVVITGKKLPDELVKLRETIVRRGAQAEAAVAAGAAVKAVGRNVGARLPKPAADRVLAWLRQLGSVEAERLGELVSRTETLTTKSKVLAAAAEAGLDPATIQALGDAVVAIDREFGRKLVRAGLMSEATFELWEGQHLRRIYEKFEDPETFIRILRKSAPEAAAKLESQLERLKALARGSKEKIPLGVVKRRKDLPVEVREALGEITEAAPRLARQAELTARAVHRAEFFAQVADNFGSKQFREGYKLIPNDKGFGKLAGMWVPDHIFGQLNQMRRVPGQLEMVSRNVVSAWKYLKVIPNPAAWARNALSQWIMADWGGVVPFYRVDIWQAAAADVLTKSNMFREAKSVGAAFADTFVTSEVRRFLNAFTRGEGGVLQKLEAAFRAAADRPAQVYQFIELWGKMAVYRAQRLAGKSAEEAARLAEQWMFNYRKVPPYIEALRSGRLGPLTVPFITYPFKALPATALAIYQQPARVTKWFKAVRAVERLGSPPTGEREALPDWMKDRFWLRLPITDGHGRSLYLDLTYILPLGDINEGVGTSGVGNLPSFLTPPLIDFIQDIQRNQSKFTGREIWPDGSTPSQKREAVLAYVGNFLLPSLLGGYSYRNIRAAVMGIPDWQGRTRSLGQALAAAFLGLKTRPVDLAQEQASRVLEIKGRIDRVKANLLRIEMDNAISEQRKEQLWQEGLDLIERLLLEIDALFPPEPQQAAATGG